MRNLIIFIFALSLSSCENEPFNQPKVQDPLKGYTIVVIDECEYLCAGSIYSNYAVLTHKGNCSNPIHKCICK